METPEIEEANVDGELKVSTSGTDRLSRKVTFIEPNAGHSPTHRMLVMVSVVLALVILVSVGCFLFLGNFGHDDMSHIAIVMRSSMNMSADPCQDFYNYACGGWHELESVRDSQVLVSSLDSLKNNYNKRVLELLEKPVEAHDPVFKTQARKFFAACKDEERRSTRGNDPFFALLKEVGKFPLLDPSWTEKDFDLQGIVTNLTRLGLHPLFTFSFDNNGVGKLISPETYMTQHRLDSNNYVEWLKTVLRLLGNTLPTEELYSEIELMLLVDRRLLRIQRTNPNRVGYVTIETLQSQYTWLNWNKYIKDIMNVSEAYRSGKATGVPARIFVDDTIYLDNLYTDGLKHFSNRTVANFLLKSILVFTQALNTSYQVSTYWRDRLIPSIAIPEDWDDRCFFEANKIIPEQLHRMYVDEYYLEEYGRYMKDLIHDLKVAFKKYFDSKEGKYSTAKDELAFLTVQNGYPDFLRSNEYLDRKLYQVPADEYFEFYVARSRFMYSYGIQTVPLNLQRFTENFVWSMLFPDSIDGFNYDGTEYILYFPAVAFQVPLFDNHWTSSMKYGSIGTLAAYTLSIQYMYQSINNEALLKIRDCFLDKFPNEQRFQEQTAYETPVRRVWSYLDFYHGVQFSFKAYRNFMYFEGEGEPRLPGLQLTHNQLFFLSFAQMMCQKIPQYKIENFLSSSRVFPDYLRVMIALQNSKEFAEAYECKQGDYMFRQETCSIL